MSDEKTWYKCDPDRNTECRKMMCFRRGGFGGTVCRRTSKPECAERDAEGNPIIAERWRGKTNGTD